MHERCVSVDRVRADIRIDSVPEIRRTDLLVQWEEDARQSPRTSAKVR